MTRGAVGREHRSRHAAHRRTFLAGPRDRRNRGSLQQLGQRRQEAPVLGLGDRDEAEIVEGLGKRGIIVRAGTPLGGPGHIRVTYGTEAENRRFLTALAELL